MMLLHDSYTSFYLSRAIIGVATHCATPSDLRVNVRDQNRVRFLAQGQIKSPVFIRGDDAPLRKRNVIAVAS